MSLVIKEEIVRRSCTKYRVFKMMRRPSLWLIVLLSACTNSYNDKLLQRLEHIKALQMFDNTVVLHPDSSRSKLFGRKADRFDPYHPYQFLRDTATTNDLVELVSSNHPYIRTYAFAALMHRNYDDLFHLLLENLNDTTRIRIFTSESAYETTPRDIMIDYLDDKLSASQRDTISQRIVKKQPHQNP